MVSVVVERRQIDIVYCPPCETYWDEEFELPKCADGSHEHRRLAMHRHLDRVVFPDGLQVTAATFDSADPYGRRQPPDYGLYFDPRWQPPWDHDRLSWPDGGLPDDDADAFLAALQAVRTHVRAGLVAEIGCLGGHGRTGTALACLAVLSGVRTGDAVAWVRANFCLAAIETPEQAAFVASFAYE